MKLSLKKSKKKLPALTLNFKLNHKEQSIQINAFLKCLTNIQNLKDIMEIGRIVMERYVSNSSEEKNPKATYFSFINSD